MVWNLVFANMWQWSDGCFQQQSGDVDMVLWQKTGIFRMQCAIETPKQRHPQQVVLENHIDIGVDIWIPLKVLVFGVFK